LLVIPATARVGARANGGAGAKGERQDGASQAGMTRKKPARASAETRLRTRYDPSMLKNLLELKPRDVPVVVGLRNTAAVVLPLAVGVAGGHPGAGLGVAVGALNTMFSDQPGPYRLRVLRMLFAAGAAGVSALLGYSVGASAVATVAAALLWGFAGGMLVALGPNAGRIGLTSMILLVVTASEPLAPLDAIGPALLFFGGGVLLMLFSIAAWPLQRYRPERQALAQLCRQLAGSARRRDDPGQAPPVSQALTDVEGLLHGSYRARGPAMDAFRILAEIVERIRLELLALADLETRLQPDEVRATLARLREYAARTLDAIAASLEGFEIVVSRRQTFYGSTEIGDREPGGHYVTFAQFQR
jgi:uncharacterized membrane protein YccC